MVKSYEIEFIGRKDVANILKEALKMDSKIEEFEEVAEGFRFKLCGARKKLVIVCRGSAKEYGCKTIVNSKNCQITERLR